MISNNLNVVPNISGVEIVNAKSFLDNRGQFVKLFNKDEFNGFNLNFNIEEIFYSYSVRDVIRGFHFQLPPFDLEKMVYVIQGKILDVVLDIRKDSPTYKKCFSIILSDENKNIIHMPKGIAHAFAVLSDSATVLYFTSKGFSPNHDSGIRWDSVGFDWGIKEPIISDKDKQLQTLEKFRSPF